MKRQLDKARLSLAWAVMAFLTTCYLVNITVKPITTAAQNPNREMSVTQGIEFLTYSPVSEAMWDPRVYLG